MRKLIIFAMLCAPMWAAPAFVQVKTASASSGAAATATFDATLTSGNFVACAAYVNSSLRTLAVTNAGTALTWSTVGPEDNSTTIRIYLFYAQVSASNVTAVTVTPDSGTPTSYLHCGEFSGIAATSPLDVGPSCTNTTGVTSHDIGTGLTTTVADSLILGEIMSTNGATFSAGTNMTLMGNLTQTGSVYRIVSSTGTYTTPITSAASETTRICGVSFKGATTSARRRVTVIQ